MIALLLSAVLLAQDPTPPPEPREVQSPPAEEFAPGRTPDPIEMPQPAAVGEQPSQILPRPAPARRHTRDTEKSSSRSADCRSLSYADAHLEACRAGLIRESEADIGQESASSLAVGAGQEKRPAEVSKTAPEEKAATRPSFIGMVILGASGLLLLSALGVLLLRLRVKSSVGVREVELTGPENLIFPPAVLVQGVRGPGKSRWSIRDGRLILTGPTGSLLNGVRLDRAGDIVSTGDTVRLGGAEYRVRII